MAPYVYESESLTNILNLPQEERRKLVTKISTQQGVFAASCFSLVWLPYTAYLGYGKSNASINSWFRTKLNASGKTAFVIMPIMFVFGMVSEQVATRLGNPKIFQKEIQSGRASTLSFPKRAANYIFDHPFQVLIMGGAPMVASIYLNKQSEGALSFSQRIMHTRVLGQFSVLALLAATMGFHDYMSKRGRFLEPWEQPPNKE